MNQIKRTEEPETDKWPHYYDGADGRGYAYSTLVNAEIDPDDAETVVSVDTTREDIHVAVELETDDIKIGLGAGLTVRDARRMANSLIQSVERQE